MAFDRNDVKLEGMVKSKPEFRADKKSVQFDLFVGYELKGEDKKVILPIVAYGKTAEAAYEKLNGGERLLVVGTLRRDKDKNIIIAALDLITIEDIG